MRIKTKFLLIIIIIFICFVIFMSFNSYEDLKKTEYNDTQEKGLIAFSYIGKISSVNKELLITDNLDIAFKDWQKITQEGTAAINTFLETKTLKKIITSDKDLGSIYDNVTFNWESAQKELENISQEMDKNYKDIDLTAERGIFYKLIEGNNPELFTFYSSIFKTDKFFNSLFNTNFNSLVSEFEKKILKLRTILDIQIFIIAFATV